MEIPKEIQYGDLVEVDLIHQKYKGIFLEPPTNEQIILLKLENGYNIGFKKSSIMEIKILEKKQDKNSSKSIVKKNLKKPNIALVICGGTIASSYDNKTGGVNWITSPEKLFEFYPEIFEIANVSKIEVPFMKGSEDMDSTDWKKIARTVETLLNDKEIQGVIVTHGTDTIHYTSSALSFFLGKLNKPVVLTYSQKSIDRPSSDASLNLKCSALIAISEIAEVVTVGHANSNDEFCYAIRGTKVRKLHTSKRDAFKPVNEPPIAKVFEDKIEILNPKYNPRNNSNKIKARTNFEDKIALLKFYPGQNPEILDYYLEKKYKGIILEMTGLGHVATSNSRNSWTQKLKEIQEKGIIICATAQTIFGSLNPLVYSNGRELMQTGIIYLKDMLSETAFTKLGWVLGNDNWNTDKELIKQKMLENFSNEFNDALEE